MLYIMMREGGRGEENCRWKVEKDGLSKKDEGRSKIKGRKLQGK